jgi:hypothetical protein
MSRFIGSPSSRAPNVSRRFDPAAAARLFSSKIFRGAGSTRKNLLLSLMTSHRVPDIFRSNGLAASIIPHVKGFGCVSLRPSFQPPTGTFGTSFFQYANEVNIRQIKMLIVGTDQQNQRITDL